MFKTSVLDAAGTLRRSYEHVDWTATPVGPMSTWSPALLNAVDLALHTEFPVTLLWGPRFVLIYNQAYANVIADKHPEALGRPAQEIFPEAWDTVGPIMESVYAGGPANWLEDEYIPLRRHGLLEEAYFTFSYSPVRGPSGEVEGVLDISAETTRQVIDRRRLRHLNRLREVLGELDRVERVPDRALAVLRENPADFPAVELGPGTVEEVVGDEARFPLGGRHRQALVVRLSEHLAHDTAYLEFLRLTASLLAQGIDRITARAAEHGLAEALQRTLLTAPPRVPGLEIAVRYRPAAELARVGGDWYDAFLGPDGVATLVVGDVAGHDQQAAAAMAQLRNLVRGVSSTGETRPATLLETVDGAMRNLHIEDYATAIVARVEADTLRWSNAGHPPPVAIAPDGAARVLASRPDLLLGLSEFTRSDHTAPLEPGTSIVLYTDGLIERRNVPFDESVAWLASILEGRQDLGAESLCNHILGELGPVEDDIALLVLRRTA